MSQDIKQHILQLEERRWNAMTSNDLATLEQLFSDDLIYTHSSAVVDDKASYLESIRSGSVQYKHVERDPVKIVVHGDTALVAGAARVSVRVRGVDKVINMRYSNVWVKQPGGWRFALWQATTVPA